MRRGHSKMARVVLSLACALSAAAGAAAQTNYRCWQGGVLVYSDRPCNSTPGAAFQQFGPVPERPTPSPSLPTPQRPPEHYNYLGAECARLSDAIRLGPSQGLRHERLNELHEEYRRRCSEDEQAARRQMYQDRSAQNAERQQRQLAQEEDRQRQRRQREQCDEMLRILHTKRQRLDELHPGQKAELERFAENYNSRCKS